MKDAMRVHINSQQGTMFRDATSTVKKHLDGILDALRQQMEQQTRYVTSAMRRDYQEVFGGQCQARRPTPEVEADIALKSDIKGQIKGTHEVFRKLIGAPTPEPEDHSGTPENREELEDADAKVDEEVKDEDDPNAAESAMVEDDAPMMEIPVAPAEHESAANIAPELEEQFDDRVADRSTDGPGEAVNPESALSPVKSEPPKQADATMEDASNLELVTEMPQAKLEDAPTADTPIYTADVEQPLNASETLAEAVDDAAAALVDS